MKWTPYHHWMWFWCWLCYRAYLALPNARDHRSHYGRFCLWLLGYGGAYAHCGREEFPFTGFFFKNREECQTAWEKHLALSSTQRECP